MTGWIRRSVTALAAAAASAAPAFADQVTLTPSQDTTLVEDANGAISNGGDEGLFAGRTAQGPGFDMRRAIIQFDLGLIPIGSTITGASLTLRVTQERSAVRTFTLHRGLASWGEGTINAGSGGGSGGAAQPGDATWVHRFYPGTAWSSPGGSFVATASASQVVNGTGAYTWSSAGMVADVQAWLNNPSTNSGWFLRGDELNGSSAKRFGSRNGTAGNRPSLVITYTPPTNVGACCIPTGCIVTSQVQCTGMSGSYQGDQTACTPSPCPTPSGACCQNNGSCQVLTQLGCSQAGGTYQGHGTACTTGACPLVLTKFVDPLPRPTVAIPITGQPGGAATYRIEMTEFQQRLHRDLPLTTVWGYGGSYPGPTIEAAVGQPVTVTWVNNLRLPGGALRTTHYFPVDTCLHGPDVFGSVPRTTVHLHGARVPPSSDGHPDSAYPPGQERTFGYPNEQLPATMWYHDHALGLTRLNVYMGLGAFYLLRDAQEAALGLPAGENEVPLLIQDRRFNTDGTLYYPSVWMEDFFGDTILVNGKVWPYLNVKRGKYRFRIVNGSNSRTYTLALSNGQSFQQIGSDGGLLTAPVTLTSVTLTPAERADIVIDFASLTAGTEVVLRNSAPAPFPGDTGVGVIPDVMKFIVQADAGYTAPVPGTLRTVPAIDQRRVAKNRDFTLRSFVDTCTGSKWLINGLMWENVTEFPRLGSTEIWSFINRSSMTHPMHVHLVQFQILDRQAFQIIADQVFPVGPRVPPAANEAGWKDTVRVMPNEIVRVIAKFDGYPGLFAYHCHILEHEDNEMMRQFDARCPADWDANGSVDPADISAFVNKWLAEVAGTTLVSDMSGNGVVDPADIAVMVNTWLNTLYSGGC